MTLNTKLRMNDNIIQYTKTHNINNNTKIMVFTII